MGDSHEETNWSIELPLSCPLFWKPDKICNFIAHISAVKLDVTTEDSENKSKRLQSLQWNWKNVLIQLKCSPQPSAEDSELVNYPYGQRSSCNSNETTHFDILTHLYYANKYVKPMKIKSIRRKMSEKSFQNPLSLLKIIRDNYMHFSKMPPMFQKALGWIEDKKLADGKWTLDKMKFVEYWTSKFPSLLTYLWLQFYEVGKEKSSILNTFYPTFLGSSKAFPLKQETFSIDLQGATVRLKEALQCDLERGGITGRFVRGERVLEIRTMDQRALIGILDNTSILKAELSSEGLWCQWYHTYRPGSKPVDKNKVERIEIQEFNHIAMIIGNEISGINQIIAELLRNSKAEKIIVYTARVKKFTTLWRRKMKQSARQASERMLREMPVQWQDLRQCAQDTVFIEGKLQIQNETVSLGKILPNSDEKRLNILSCLQGDLLNQLLKARTATLSQALKIKQASEVYILRKIIPVEFGGTEFEESDFLNHIRLRWSKEKTVVIVDKTGNGKSSFLSRLALKSSESFQNHFTLFFTMTELVEKASSENVSRESIVDALSSIVGPVEFKRRLYKHWLGYYSDQNGFRFELFVDGLDEVGLAHIKVALDILKHIQNFPSVAVCITLGGHVLKEYEKYFENADIYKLEPFSPETQEEFLVKYWQSKNKKQAQDIESRQLRDFARKCLSLHFSEQGNDIGSPLICRILAEVYEREALSGRYLSPSACSTLFELYDRLWNRKITKLTETMNISHPNEQKENPLTDIICTEMRKWHCFLAIKLLFGEEVASKFKLWFITVKPKQLSSVLQLEIVTSIKPPTFIHQTFAYDFVAQFIAAVFNGKFFNLEVDSFEFKEFLSHHVLAAANDPFKNIHMLIMFGRIVNSLHSYPSLLEHWFVQSISNYIIYYTTSDVNFEPVKGIVQAIVKKSQFDGKQNNSEGKTPLLLLLSMQPSLFIAMMAQFLVNDLKADIHVADKFGNTGLHVTHKCSKSCWYKCCLQDNIDIAECYVELWGRMLQDGLSRDAVNAINKDGETPILTAINVFKRTAFCAVKFFKQNGADFDVKNKKGETALDKAIAMKDRNLFLTLIESDANVEGIRITYENISVVIEMGCQSVLEKLIEKTFASGFYSFISQGDTLAHEIVKHCSNQLIIKLLESEDTMLVENKDGVTPLQIAVLKNVELFKFYVSKYKLDINSKDAKGKTLLHKLVNPKVIPEFYICNADFNAKDDGGETVLERAIRIGNGALVDALVNDGAVIAKLGKSYECVFSLALIGSVSALITYMHVFNMIFDFKMMNFEKMMRENDDDESRLELMKLCVEKYGVNVRTKDKQGKTYLHRSIKEGNEQFIKTLVELGADINEPDSSGESALHLAAMESSALLLYFINEFNADLNEVGRCGNTAFHHAIQSSCDDYRAIETLLKVCDVDIEILNRKGQNVFYLAAAAGNYSYFDLLRKKNDFKDANRKSLVDYMLDIQPLNENSKFFWPSRDKAKEKYLFEMYQHGKEKRVYSIICEKMLKIQNSEVKLSALVPVSGNDRVKLLSCVQGDLLTQLLIKETATLFEGIKAPNISQIYIPRQIFKIGVVKKNILDTAPGSEAFVIFRITSYEQLEKVFKEFVVLRYTNTSYYCDPTKESKIFWAVEEPPYNFEEICSALRTKYKNIHFLRYLHNSTFEWMCTQGSTMILKDLFVKQHPNTGVFDEKDFLNYVRSRWKMKKIVAIVNTPETGRSNFLARLASKSRESFENHLTFFFTMSELVEKLGSMNVNEKRVVEALSNMVGPSIFERKLCEYWLQSKDSNNFIQYKFEIFVDALNDANVNYRGKAFTILKHLHELSSVSLCITLRDDFLIDLQKCCMNTEVYGLDSFTIETQVCFLVEFWQSKRMEKLVDRELETLTNFAWECLDLHLAEREMQIAGTPLICRIVAEIYEKHALSGDYRTPYNCTSLCNLYDLFWERKFEVWLEKLEITPGKTIKESPQIDSIRISIQNCHTYFALMMLFGKETANKFKLCLLSSDESLNKMQSTVLQQGIITSLNPPTFINQTFAEDLVARFVVAVFDGNCLSLKVDSYDFEHFLCHHALAVDEVTKPFNRFKHPTLCYILNARSQNQKNIFSSNIPLTIATSESFFFRQVTSCASSIRTAIEVKFSNLLALLFYSPVFVIGFFEYTLTLGNVQYCKLMLEYGHTQFFDNDILSRYCKVNSQVSQSIEHWFIQNVWRYHLNKHNSVRLFKEILPVMKKNPQFDLERLDSQGRTPLLFLLSLHTSFEIPEAAKIMVTDFGANVNAVDNFGNTVLHATHKCTTICVRCCTKKHMFYAYEYVGMWKSLLKAGLGSTAVNAKNNDGETPLLSVVEALKEEAFYTLQFFKENGANFNVKDRWGETVLDKAIKMKDGRIFDALVKCGANADDFGNTFERISSLIKMNCPGALKQLIFKFGADFHNLTGEGDPLPHQIIKKFDNELVIQLFDSRVNMNVIDLDGTSALHLAATKNIDLLKICVEIYKLDVNVKDSKGKTLLHKICSSKLIPKMRELGADFNAKDDDGETVLERAIRIGNRQLVDALVMFGADIGKLGKNYDYVFSLALIGCNSVLRAYMETFGNTSDFKNDDDESCLELMKLCVEKYGVNVRTKDKQGKTYLHKSIKEGNEQFIKTLVELGADINEPDSSGESALHLAAMESDSLLLYFFKEFNADVNMFSLCGNTAFHHAVQCSPKDNSRKQYKFDNSDSIKSFLKSCDIGLVNEMGQNVLQLAVTSDNIYYYRWLRRNFDIDLNFKDANGKTFFDYLIQFRPLRVWEDFLSFSREKEKIEYLSKLYNKYIT